MAHIYILEYKLEFKVLEKFYPSKFDRKGYAIFVVGHFGIINFKGMVKGKHYNTS